MSGPIGTPEPLQHVLRPQPPWRDLMVTECGRPTNDLAAVLTRDEFVAKVTRLGQQRSAMTTCMTCWETARNHPAWDQSPVAVMGRITRDGQWGKDAGMVNKELRAIAHLIDAHREEFDGLLDGLSRTDDLASARKKRLGRQR